MSDPNQFFVFLVCVSCGIAGGFVYDFIYCVRYPFPSKWVRFVSDVIFCMIFTLIYLFASVLMQLPDLRLYTFLGCAAGLFLYLKSFHKIVAFFAGKVYNGIKQTRKEKRVCPRGKFSLTKKKRKKSPSAQR